MMSPGLQQKYVRVKSTDYLDVHFFMWGKAWWACSALVLEEITPGRPSVFFSKPGQKDISLGEIETYL